MLRPFPRPLILLMSMAAFCAFSTVLRAQPSPSAVFERISTEQGLSFPLVSSILQDRQGFLWIGTHNGLNRYDGHDFVHFLHTPTDPASLADNYVNTLYDDSEGLLWIGTSNGLSRYNPTTDLFTTYRHTPSDSLSLSHDNVVSIHETRAGVLWVGTEQGLNRYDPDTQGFTQHPLASDDSLSLRSKGITALLEDAAGTLWVGTRHGLHTYERGTERLAPYQPDVSRPPPAYDVYTLYEDARSHLWVGTLGNGLIQIDLATGIPTTYMFDPNNPHSLPSNVVFDITADQDGYLWVGTWEGGLGRLDVATARFTRYMRDFNDEASLSDNRVTAILEDRTGTLWAGTWNGLNKMPDQKAFTTYTYRPGIQDGLSFPSVSAVVEDEAQQLWIGTAGGGLGRLDRTTGAITHFRHDVRRSTSLGNDQVTALEIDHEGTLWVGTVLGLDRFDAQTQTFKHYRHDEADTNSLSSNWIYSAYADAQSTLWVATADRGLNRFDPALDGFVRFQHDPRDTTSLSSNAVWPVLEDRTGALWAGTLGGGLNRFDQETGFFTQYHHAPTEPRSLSNDRVISLHMDEIGVLWIGTMGGGLNRFDQDSERFRHYTKQDGLPASDVACILSDDRGHLWIGTSNGLSRFDSATQRFDVFSTADGLPNPIFNVNACTRTQREEMVFGTAGGLVVFHPDSLGSRVSSSSPPIVITGLDLFNRPASLDSSITHIRQITLPYDQNFLTLRYVALNFKTVPGNEYAYRLEGWDKEWNNVMNRRYASYPNLAPGKYTFRVRVAGSDGEWSGEEASVRVVVTPPFWLTWWFRVLIVLLVGGLLALAYRYRVHHLLELERTRQRIADDLHDDIGSKMSSIALKLELSSRSGNLDEEARRQFSDFSQTTRHLIRDLRDTVWIVDAKEDDLVSLVDRMKDTAQEMLTDHVLDFEKPQALPSVPLPMATRRHIFLMFKEVLHNAMRHAQATHVNVHIAYSGHTLSITIEDDGRGFDVEHVRRGRGLRTIHARARQLGASLDINSRVGDGTTVRISVGLPSRTRLKIGENGGFSG